MSDTEFSIEIKPTGSLYWLPVVVSEFSSLNADI
jgi:hypothetical protein